MMWAVWVLCVVGGSVYLIVYGWFRFKIYLLDYLGIDVGTLVLKDIPINDIPYEDMRRKFKEKKVLLRLRENRLREMIVRGGFRDTYLWVPGRPVLYSIFKYLRWFLYSLQLEKNSQSLCRAYERELFKLIAAERMFGFNINYIED